MLIRADEIMEPAFLEMVLNSPPIKRLATEATTGGAAPRVNVATVKSYPIPIPSRAEQQSILSKVKELMSLCDEMERAIEDKSKIGAQFLDATLHEALAQVS